MEKTEATRVAQSNLFTATYIGGPTAILEIGGLRLMIDPNAIGL